MVHVAPSGTAESGGLVELPRSGWSGVGFILDGADWEKDEVAFILHVPGGCVDILDLRKAAAAPELLAALTALLACNEAEEGAEQDFSAALEAAHAAIAKARGE